MHMTVTGDRTVSAQNTAGDHVKKSSQETNSSGNGSSACGHLMRNELAAQEADEAKQKMFVTYYRKDAQYVNNGWWLSLNDRAWNARETKGRRLETGSTKGKGKSKLSELKKLTMPVHDWVRSGRCVKQNVFTVFLLSCDTGQAHRESESACALHPCTVHT